MEPRVTEIKVRMDCNGCAQKIKKALRVVNGIYHLYIDFPQQKLTIVGSADPRTIINAIRKTRKIATICSVTEPPVQPPPMEVPPAEPPENHPPPPDAAEQDKSPTDHHQPNYGHGCSRRLKNGAEGRAFLQEPPPPVTHSYNSYQPSIYVTEYEYIRPSLYCPENYSNYCVTNYYRRDNGYGNIIASMFSDDNPNACTIL